MISQLWLQRHNHQRKKICSLNFIKIKMFVFQRRLCKSRFSRETEPIGCVCVCVCVHIHVGFPGGASGKELTWQCRRPKRRGFDPWVRKIPWRRARQPILVFLPGESHGQRRLVGYSPLRGVAMSGTQLKRLSMTHAMWFTATETPFWKLEVWKQDLRRAMISLKKREAGLSHLL